MKLFLHPGHAKCGSTSIQQWVRQNFEQLHTNGLAVPDSDFHRAVDASAVIGTTYSYLLRVIESGNINRFQSDTKLLLREYSKDHTALIWSDEFLSDPRVLTNSAPIHQILSDEFDSVSVLYYIRRQDDFILSAWQQWRHKVGESLEQSVQASIANHQPDYLMNIRLLESIYGPENVTVRPLSTKEMIGGDLIKDFCATLNIEYDLYKPLATPANISLNPYICEILSLSSKSIYDNDYDNCDVFHWFEQFGHESIAFDPCKEFMTTEMRLRVLESFDCDNRVLHSEFFPNVEFQELFGTKTLADRRNEIFEIKKILSLQFEMLYKFSRSFEQRESLVRKIFRKINNQFSK